MSSDKIEEDGKTDPTNKPEEQILQEIYPKLVWNIIIDKMKNSPDTLEKCSNVSYFFRDLLESKRNLYLFPKVLPFILETQQYKRDQSKLLLKLRTVCKSWCKTIDDFSQFKPTYTHPNEYNFPPFLIYMNSQSELLAHFQDTHTKDGIPVSRSPFIGNSVKMTICVYHNVQQEAADILPDQTALNTFGHHILHCHLTFGLSKCKNEWYSQVMLRILQKMPNLKTLYIKQDDKENVAEEDVARLRNLPDFKDLHYLKSENLSNEFLRTILARAPNLVTLVVSSEANAATGTILLPPSAPFPKLQHLTVDARQGFHGRNNDIRIPFMTLAAQPGLQISRLDMSLPVTSLPAEDMHRLWRRHSINLPCLTSLKLYVKQWPCLDFLMQLRNTLKEFSLESLEQESPQRWMMNQVSICTKGDEYIDYLNSLGNIEPSVDVWRILSHLEIFSVRHFDTWKRWTRNGQTQNYVIKSISQEMKPRKYRLSNLLQ